MKKSHTEITIKFSTYNSAYMALEKSNINRYKYGKYFLRCVDDCFANRYLLYELYCSRTDKYYIGHLNTVTNLDVETSTCSLSTYELIFASNENVMNDSKHLGISEFRHRILGLYPTIDSVNKYKSFLLNEYLDDNKKLYNDEIFDGTYKRTFIVFTSYEQSEKVVDYCTKKNWFVSVFFNKLLSKVSELKDTTRPERDEARTITF